VALHDQPRLVVSDCLGNLPIAMRAVNPHQGRLFMFTKSSTPFVEPGSSVSLDFPRTRTSSAPRQHTVIDGITYKVADGLAEREAAFQLVYDAYRQRGLMEPSPHRMRVTPYHLLDTTDVLIALDGEQVIYTVTLVRDGELGLPMEDIYADEIRARRHDGLQLAEPSCLASRQDHFGKTRMFMVCTRLIGLMFQFARANRIDRVVAAVHPRHGNVYTRSFGFEQIGGLKTYASVRDNPAVACEHDFAKLDQIGYRLYDQVYRTQFASWKLQRKPMSSEERAYFTSVAMQKTPHAYLAAS
jgi:hypothetical protein